MGKNVPSYVPNTFAVLGDFARCGFLAMLFLFSSLPSFSQLQRIRDLNDAEDGKINEFSNLVSANNKIYFVSLKKELWVAYQDTDPNATDRVAKLRSFVSVDKLFLAGPTLYFIADDGVHGAELWKSNGTVAGTSIVKDVYPGSTSSNPDNFVFNNQYLFFTATAPGSGTELWRSNATSSGTILVKDILAGGGSSRPASLTNVNGTVYFSANNGPQGIELWKSNGTSAGTLIVKDLAAGDRISSAPRDLVNVNGVLYFTANQSATGRELYKSNGTSAGTILIKDIRPGTLASGIENLTALNGKAVFTANNGISGHELWSSDGTAAGTSLLKDMTPGPTGSHGKTATQFRMGNFTVINNMLYFTAYQGNTYYAWKCDGTTAGTATIFEAIGPYTAMPRPDFNEMNGKIFFFNDYWAYGSNYDLVSMNPDGSGIELVFDLYLNYQSYHYPKIAIVTNPLGQKQLYTFGIALFSGMKLVRSGGSYDNTDYLYDTDPLVATQSSAPTKYTPFKGQMAFIAKTTFYQSESVCITDGNTIKEVINFQGDGDPDHPFTIAGGYIYGSGSYTLELYKSDGQEQWGYTEILVDYNMPPAKMLTGTNTHVYFTNVNGELWRIDGTTNEVALMKDFHSIQEIKSIGNAIIFRVATASSGEEWWRSNGTVGGTYRIKLIRSGAANEAYTKPSAMVKNVYYFVSNNGVNGNEIWRSGGVGTNTFMLADLNTNDNAFLESGREYDISAMAAFRDSLYVSAVGNDGNWALFKSNGSAGNITKVVNLNAARTMFAVGNKLYLFVYGPDNKTGMSLWVTNGTASGTKMLRQFTTVTSLSTHGIGNDLYFTFNGSELWKSDGTECGTISLPIGNVQPYDLSGVGSVLLLSGYELLTGIEPYRYNTLLAPADPCESTLVARESTDEHRVLQHYPNPFTDQMSFNIATDEAETASVVVTTIDGLPVMRETKFDVNHDYQVGQQWAPGMYIMKITYGGKIETRILVKK